MFTTSDSTSLGKSKRDEILGRIGGPHAISWPSFILTLGFTLVFGSVGASASDAGWRWIVPALVGQSAAYAILFVAKRTVLRTTRIRPRPGRTIASFAFAALVAGNASGAVARSLTDGEQLESGPPNGAVALFAVLATIVAFTAVASFAAVIVDSYRGHTSWTSERDTKLRRLRDLRSSSSVFLETLRGQQRSLVLQELTRLRDEIPARTFADLEAEIRHSTFEILRPMSHDLANPARSEIPESPALPPDLREFFADTISRRLIRPLTLSILSSIPPAFTVLFEATLESAILHIVLTFLTLVIGSVLLQVVIHRASRVLSRLLIGSAGILLLSLCPAAIASLVLDGDIAGQVAATSIFSVLVFGFLGPIFGAGRHAYLLERRDRISIDDAIEHETSLLRQRDYLDRAELSRIIHGRVQSTLLACALKLSTIERSSGSTLDDHVLRSWLNDTLQLLIDRVRAPETAAELSAGIAELVSLWKETCDIEVDVHHVSPNRLSETTLSAILAIIEEISTNAIRHGGARKIKCRVESTSRDTVTVVIESDSKQSESPSTRGLGSALLDDVSLTWTPEWTAQGLKVVAVVPTTARRTEEEVRSPRHTS
jgi:signal transduction histidine kinase